jgi:drug/metabolite transporter (DMT)-like permease
MNSWLAVVGGILFSAAAQLLLKLGATGPGERPLEILRAIWRWQVLLGAVLYVLAFFLYLQVLARLDLSYAAPVMLGGVLLLVSLAGATLGESIGPVRILGTGLVIAGIVLLSVDATRG